MLFQTNPEGKLAFGWKTPTRGNPKRYADTKLLITKPSPPEPEPVFTRDNRKERNVAEMQQPKSRTSQDQSKAKPNMVRDAYGDNRPGFAVAGVHHQAVGVNRPGFAGYGSVGTSGATMESAELKLARSGLSALAVSRTDVSFRLLSSSVCEPFSFDRTPLMVFTLRVPYNYPQTAATCTWWWTVTFSSTTWKTSKV